MLRRLSNRKQAPIPIKVIYERLYDEEFLSFPAGNPGEEIFGLPGK
jgi:hypothetical protein